MADNDNPHIAALSDRDILMRILDELVKLNGRIGSLERSRSWFKGWIAAFSCVGAVLSALWAAKALGAF